MRGLRESIEWACALEVLAAKPGNVSPGREFPDLSVADLLLSGLSIAPILEMTADLGVGRAILDAVLATKSVTKSNANLGIILLLAPLCAADTSAGPTPDSVKKVLDALTVDDARLAYEAIREARPGGLGSAPREDVSSAPTVTLLEAMRLAGHRDSVARMYGNGFREVFDLGAPSLEAAIAAGCGLEEAIVWCHLHWMAKLPDTLIERKLGPDVAIESQKRARHVIEAIAIESRGDISIPRPGFLCRPEVTDLDGWLRSDGHRRNPGTSADLVAASLFLALRTDRVDPKRMPWHRVLPPGSGEPEKDGSEVITE